MGAIPTSSHAGRRKKLEFEYFFSSLFSTEVHTLSPFLVYVPRSGSLFCPFG